MITETVVGVAAREASGTNANRRLRRDGKIPGIVYGMDIDPFPVAVSERTIVDVLRLKTGRNTIFTLSLEGSEKQSKRAVMIKDLQRDPVSERLVHVDFIRVDMEKKVTVAVPIRLLGTPEGVKNEGGVVEFIQRQVQVECLPGIIPEQIDLDISDLHLNMNALIKDLEEVEGVEILDDPDSPVMGVIAPRGLEVAEEEVEEEEAEGEEEAEDKKEETDKAAGEGEGKPAEA